MASSTASDPLVVLLQCRPTSLIPIDLHTIEWIDFYSGYDVGFHKLLASLRYTPAPTSASPKTPPSSSQGDVSTDYTSGSQPPPPNSPYSSTPPSAQKRAGENIEQPLVLSLAEAYNSTIKTFIIKSPEICSSCRGSGEVNGKTCATCEGQGQMTRTQRLEVRIPAGVDTGSKVRVAGQGQLGIGGGPRGDLFLIVEVHPDANIRRTGDDLFMDVALSASIAKQGGEVPITLPDGKRLGLTIPPETQNGQVFRLIGKGMANVRTGSRGNLYTRVLIALG